MPLKRNSLESFVLTLNSANSDEYESLKKENFHFHVADNLISLFEKMKCHQSNNEHISVKQHMKSDESAFEDSLLLPCSYSSSSGSTSNKENSSDIIEPYKHSSIENSFLSLSDSISNKSACNDRKEDELTDKCFSAIQLPEDNFAESIAIRLIFKNYEHSDNDRNFCISDFDNLCYSKFNFNQDLKKCNTKFRGNDQWAPPREQLIFRIHEKPNRISQLHQQNCRCAGCGLYIEPDSKEFSRLLFCYYTGKLYCSHGCHSRKRALIPARIIMKWEFKLFPVSNFSYKFLNKIRFNPLFNINDINTNLVKNIQQFGRLRDFRYQLRTMTSYIKFCRNSGRLTNLFSSFEPQYFLYSDEHLYAINELIIIKKCSTLEEKCYNLVKEALTHFIKCSFCIERGFICEICGVKDVLFPFEIKRVYQCSECGSCYHDSCFKMHKKCPKCIRIKMRKGTK